MSDYDNGFARAQRAYDNMEDPSCREDLSATDTMEIEFGITVKKWSKFWSLRRGNKEIDEKDLTVEEAELFQTIKDEWAAKH
jgi:hypothetical protein